MWIISKDKKYSANINQAKFAFLDGKAINVDFGEEKIFHSEFETEEEARKKFDRFNEFWAAQTWDEFMENF